MKILTVNSQPDSKCLDWTKFKAFVDKNNVEII